MMDHVIAAFLPSATGLDASGLAFSVGVMVSCALLLARARRLATDAILETQAVAVSSVPIVLRRSRRASGTGFREGFEAQALLARRSRPYAQARDDRLMLGSSHGDACCNRRRLPTCRLAVRA